MFNRDLAGTRYSPLTQINTANVATLTQAWSYRLQPAGFRFATAGGTSELVPIVVNGVMYISAQTRVMALEPETGKEIWRYEVQAGQASPRGVALLAGRPPESSAHHVYSRAQPDRAERRNRQTRSGLRQRGHPSTWWCLTTAFPPSSRTWSWWERAPERKRTVRPGNTRAFDARTGAKLWEFQTDAGPGETGHETWLNDGWKDRSGTNIWAWYMTADEERGIVYMTFGAPAANYYGGDRPGANLFGNSVVAVDAATGKYKWHFQVVHHDLWDYDLPPAPVLVDIVVNGKKIPALAQIGKSGWMFILNRVTGKPVFGVEERPVPKGDVPGEWYSPTQPFPMKPVRRCAHQHEARGTGDRRRHHARARQSLPGAVGQERSFTMPVHSRRCCFMRTARRPKITVSFPGCDGRRELGRHGGGSEVRLRFPSDSRSASAGLGREEAARPPL